MKNINPSLITNPTDKLSVQQLSSFSYPPKPVMLGKGDRAFRFCMHQGHPMSAFWFLKSGYDELFSIYHSELINSRELEPDENARQRFSRIFQNSAAVLHQFPDSKREFMIVNFTVKITFKIDVVGYIGPTKTQQTFMPVNSKDIQSYNTKSNPIYLKERDERIKERKQGGLEQLVIPRFQRLMDEHNLQKINSLVEIVVVPF